jgi:hypothetical protein
MEPDFLGHRGGPPDLRKRRTSCESSAACYRLLMSVAICETAVSARPLSRSERERLRQLEAIIQRGLETFFEVGRALEEIRSSRLYRQTYPTFAAYVRDRWAISLSRANQLALSMRVAENLLGAGVIESDVVQSRPEAFFRPLSRLSPELQIASMELIQKLEPAPDTGLVKEVVGCVRSAIAEGCNASGEESSSARASGSHQSAPGRDSNQLAALSRWANKLALIDPETVASGDDHIRLKQHLKAAQELMDFCSRLIVALTNRLQATE